MLPSFFIAHGSPMLAVETNAYTECLRNLGSQLNPRAVVLFSAHWESPAQAVSQVDQYKTIHDFGGFPDELYGIQYPAPGDAKLSAEIVQLLKQEGVPTITDQERGLDHGAWVVLRMLYPNAKVPVVAMSVNANLPHQEQYRIGKALAHLRTDDILIVASGGTVHNFATLRWRSGESETDAWAVQFDDWVFDKMSRWDLDALFHYETLAPNARLAVPPHGSEHFIPLFYALGAANDRRIAKEVHRSYQFGNLSHAVWQFGM